jgi:hypothetical protein
LNKDPDSQQLGIKAPSAPALQQPIAPSAPALQQPITDFNMMVRVSVEKGESTFYLLQ